MKRQQQKTYKYLIRTEVCTDIETEGPYTKNMVENGYKCIAKRNHLQKFYYRGDPNIMYDYLVVTCLIKN